MQYKLAFSVGAFFSVEVPAPQMSLASVRPEDRQLQVTSPRPEQAGSCRVSLLPISIPGLTQRLGLYVLLLLRSAPSPPSVHPTLVQISPGYIQFLILIGSAQVMVSGTD